jgi:predicted ATPase
LGYDSHEALGFTAAYPMIDRVHFENFKSLADVTIDLGRLTVLVGANGCGKSSVLQGIALLSAKVRALEQVAAGRNVSIFSQLFMYRRRAGDLVVAMHSSNGTEARVETRFAVGQLTTEDFARPGAPLSKEFGSVAHLHLDANEMTQTSIAEDESPRMGDNGGGLPSALAWMKGAAEDELAQITADLRRVVPGVKRIRTLRERITNRRMEKLDIDGQPIWRPVDESQIGDRFEIEFDDGSEIPAHMLSEGTVLALGLLTKLREPNRPKLLLIDDIDRGLHLGAQASLVRALRELMKLDPELQIVCTTHSPYLLDLFDPTEVRVLALDAERRTHVRPLTEHPDFGKWKFGTQTGELWAALGEDWVTAGVVDAGAADRRSH